uniref:chloroplastic group IIA intron splicing facilitator CRS1, chloroplastic isoform X2 n=1 Tax=Erigeron canadensis TaxID=72917 RepID=UPI001CB8DA30|nr:chloroplastic group IIA intron splicing facilitator CRS1, chloroplastic isoform X2 [Erigeron canadensis]
MSSTMFLSPTMLTKFPKITNSTPQNQPNSISVPTPEKNHPNSATKTAPWMKGPLVLKPNQVIDFTKPKSKKKASDNNDKKPTNLLTKKVSGGRGKQAMKKILCSIDNLEEKTDAQKKLQDFEFDLELGVLGDDDYDSGDGDKKWVRRKMPWEKTEKMVFRRMKKEKIVTAADMNLDEELLERLRNEARKMRNWVKVKKVGVSEGVVEQIRLIWKSNELAMLKFDMPLCRNMDRAREIVELKTGGFVVWSRKDILVIYRGCNYRYMSRFSRNMYSNGTIYETVDGHDDKGETIPVQGSLYEREADRLLDGLGPRFVDWWMPKPLPVDADLLPEVVRGYKPPSRLYPLRGRAQLTDRELTHLRKRAYYLPTHFVLGRNRNLQGLAAAILKLWEKCHIAKIAVKWGIPNTSNEQMASELKLLTGGVLLLRNKFYIILYRGKDFLPPNVADLVADREMELYNFQLQEETARAYIVETFDYIDQPLSDLSTVGTLKEFQIIQTEHEGSKAGISEAEVQVEAEKLKLEKEIRIQEHKYFILKTKMRRALKELEKLNSSWDPIELNEDREIITTEERECLRKMGLKMDSTTAWCV